MEGKVALVTGGTKGIGLQIAKQLAQKGFNIIITARNEVPQATQQIRDVGVSCDFVPMDISSDSDIAKAHDFVNNKYGKLDILINNAAIASLPDPKATVRDNFLKMYNSNVAGVAVILDTFYELLKKSAHPRIVNVSSGYGSLTRASKYGTEHMPYRVTKASLNLLTVVYSQKFKEIKVNAICPGYCKTDLNGFAGTRDPAVGAKVAVNIALIEDDGPTGSFFEVVNDDSEITVASW